jgi:hypothetical protein
MQKKNERSVPLVRGLNVLLVALAAAAGSDARAQQTPAPATDSDLTL